MSPIEEVILNKNVNINPIWIMRQAGRYLPEFRKIRKENPDFIKLCLNEKLSTELTLQPLIRYDLDAAIIFSDILMLPYGLNQKVEFIKGTGPILGNIDLENISKLTESDFLTKADIESANNAFPAVGPKRLFNPQQQMPMTWPKVSSAGN